MVFSSFFYFSHPTIESLIAANTQQINDLIMNSDGVNPNQLFHKFVHLCSITFYKLNNYILQLVLLN
jgi:hypothetical protein